MPMPTVFPGADALLGLIRRLSRRPGYFAKGLESGLRGDQPLPLICLIREPDQQDNAFLASLADRLDSAEPPQVPHVLVDAATAQDESGRIWHGDPNTPIG